MKTLWTISVLIPTYKRTADLERCLRSIEVQERPADEVVIVIRSVDEASRDFLTAWLPRLPLVIKQVEVPGQVHALNSGLAASRGEIIAITDDDAAPRPDWLKRIEEHFLRDEGVGAVGGRDWVHHGPTLLDGKEATVGSITWFGRLIGNHHLGVGTAREVSYLKGANMSYRRSATDGLLFNARLRGKGAQVCNDLAFSLAVGQRGWKLIYDPDVAVDHYPAIRFDADQRDKWSAEAIEDAAFNQYLSLASGRSAPLRQRFACKWLDYVGTRSHPGLLHLLLALMRRDEGARIKWRAARTGRKAARQMSRSIKT